MSRSLAGFNPKDFLEYYWQREPLLLRRAIPDFVPPISADELAGLALEDDIESRIVTGAAPNGNWSLEHGPFDEARFAATGESDWTLLVQGVDLWVPDVAALLEYFDFLPRWRIDDVMVSYAAPGGSVGPHFDYYDVFLLQAEGERDWRIGQRCDAETPLDTESGLKLLETFEESGRWRLEPGDVLYLPPQLAHWGVATSECLTCSIGFRSPTLAEILDDLATELMARGDDRYYRDPPLTPGTATERIDPAFVEQAASMLRELAADETLLTDWFARYMTAPKYPDLDLNEGRVARTATSRYIDGETDE